MAQESAFITTPLGDFDAMSMDHNKVNISLVQSSPIHCLVAYAP